MTLTPRPQGSLANRGMIDGDLSGPLGTATAAQAAMVRGTTPDALQIPSLIPPGRLRRHHCRWVRTIAAIRSSAVGSAPLPRPTLTWKFTTPRRA